MQRTDLLLHCFLGENRADDAASRIGALAKPLWLLRFQDLVDAMQVKAMQG